MQSLPHILILTLFYILENFCFQIVKIYSFFTHIFTCFSVLHSSCNCECYLGSFFFFLKHFFDFLYCKSASDKFSAFVCLKISLSHFNFIPLDIIASYFIPLFSVFHFLFFYQSNYCFLKGNLPFFFFRLILRFKFLPFPFFFFFN